MLRLLMVVFCSLAIVACGTKDEKKLATKPAELVDFDATASLKKLWSINAGSGLDKRYARFVPAIENDAVFVADTKGRVFAYGLESQKRKWQVDTRLPIGGALEAASGMVFFGTYDGELVALNSDDGKTLWATQLSSEVVAPPSSDGSTVVAQAIDGSVFALEAKTGKVLWSYDHPVPVLTLRGTSSPVIVANQVIVGFDNGQLLSFGLSDGVTQWDVRISRPQGRTELEKIVDIDGTPSVSGAYIYAASSQGNVVAINRGTGRVMWTKNVNTANRVAVAHGNVYVSDASGKIMAFNALNGDEVWENFALKNRSPLAPTVIGDFVAVIEDEDEYLHLLNASDGSFAYRFKPSGSGFRSPPYSFRDVLYILADNGKLSAYTLAE